MANSQTPICPCSVERLDRGFLFFGWRFLILILILIFLD